MGNSITLSMCSQVSFLILKSLIGIAWNSLCKQTLLFLRWCRGIPEASGFVGMGFMHFFLSKLSLCGYNTVAFAEVSSFAISSAFLPDVV